MTRDFMNYFGCLTGFPLALVLSASLAAHADVTISTAATQNMNCANGVCSPTASDAVLNVADLESLLVSGNVEVTTTGSGVQANNIDVQAALGWGSNSALALDAYDSIAVDRPVSVTGTAKVTLTTNDGGSGGALSFGAKGNMTFADLSSSLTINGAPYVLVDSVATLAAAIAAKPKKNYALANSYDASGDGTYTKSPVATPLQGVVEGLGNTISNITVLGRGPIGGLFKYIGTQQEPGGVVENLGLENANVESTGGRFNGEAGGLVAHSWGNLLFGDHVGGRIQAVRGFAGGLAGTNSGGTISNSYSTAHVSGGKKSGFYGAGGLVGTSDGPIIESYTTGLVDGPGAGGLVGSNYGGISNSYALGQVTEKRSGGAAGGLLAGLGNTGTVSSSYSTGKVSANGQGALIGGFIGDDGGLAGSTSDCYWDTTTSGTDQGTGEGNVQGLTGLTTQQLKSGLPAGFDPTIWAQDKKINSGFPYLIANPPVE